MMNSLKRLFRKETVSEVMRAETTQTTVTVITELKLQEIIRLMEMDVNLCSPEISWKRKHTNKLVIYDIRGIKSLDDINLISFNSMFSDIACGNSTLFLAILMYRIVEETYKNGQKFASFSKLLTYSFEEDGQFCTPQDIEKSLAKHCLVMEDSEDE